MKKIGFIAILLIGLGAAWTLYLEHNSKRFADNLPKEPATTQQPDNTSEAPTIGDKNNQAARADSVPAEITAKNARVWHEHAGPHPQPQVDTQQAPIEVQAGKNPAENVADSNPVPPEVITDSKRDLEWYRALKEWQAKDEALSAEWYELDQELDALISFSLEEVQRMTDKEKAALRAKANDLKAKSKAWDKKKAELDKQKPVRPTPTHTH